MVKKYNEVNIEGDRVFLRKDFLGWHTIFPGEIDGKRIWKNTIAGGSWLKLIFVILFVSILIGATFEISGIIQTANECLNKTMIPQIQNISQLIYP